MIIVWEDYVPKIERFWNIHNGGIVGKDHRTSREMKLTCLFRERSVFDEKEGENEFISEFKD